MTILVQDVAQFAFGFAIGFLLMLLIHWPLIQPD